MTHFENEYREKLVQDCNKYIRIIAEKQINKEDCSEELKILEILRKQIAALDIENEINRINNYNTEKERNDIEKLIQDYNDCIRAIAKKEIKKENYSKESRMLKYLQNQIISCGIKITTDRINEYEPIKTQK